MINALFRSNLKCARWKWGSELSPVVLQALRTYTTGICSYQEIGLVADTTRSERQKSKPPSQRANANYGATTLPARLCQITLHHHHDPNLENSYAVDSCGTKPLREADNEQVE